MERLDLGLKDSKDEILGIAFDTDGDDEEAEAVVGDSRSSDDHGTRSKAGSCEAGAGRGCGAEEKLVEGAGDQTLREAEAEAEAGG